MPITKLVVISILFTITGCSTVSYHPWLHDAWHMHHCRNGTYRCEWWQPISKDGSETGYSELNNKLAVKPFQECKMELQSVSPAPETTAAAEEIVKQCMAKKGWEHFGVIGLH